MSDECLTEGLRTVISVTAPCHINCVTLVIYAVAWSEWLLITTGASRLLPYYIQDDSTLTYLQYVVCCLVSHIQQSGLSSGFPFRLRGIFIISLCKRKSMWVCVSACLCVPDCLCMCVITPLYVLWVKEMFGVVLRAAVSFNITLNIKKLHLLASFSNKCHFMISPEAICGASVSMYRHITNKYHRMGSAFMSRQVTGT